MKLILKLCLTTLLFLQFFTLITSRQIYIIHTHHHKKPQHFPTHEEWYQSLSQSSLLYTYTTAYQGFAASLTSKEADDLRKHQFVIGVYEDHRYMLHTTRTPDFLGLDSEIFTEKIGRIEKRLRGDVIIGVLDTGVWPESRSFDDHGMTEVPLRWKGACESRADFEPSSCNRKLIGARSFSKGYKMSMRAHKNKTKDTESPRDVHGHGTHTASTAAGAHVANASLLGYASGVARGMAPGARVAVYKVCWTGCFGSDILAGMESAIHDGVDVLSMSLGSTSHPYYQDTIAIGAFTAVEKGIFVSCSAGNSGPKRGSVSNVAPWIMTVGAGTLDRGFPAFIKFGKRRRFGGVSLYTGKGMGNKPVEVYYNNQTTNGSGNLCLRGSLDPKLVRGKIVFCERGVNGRTQKGLVVQDAGGVGMILANTAESGEELVADSHVIPAVAVGKIIGDKIREVLRSELRIKAQLSFGGTILNVRPSPVIATFSSRGPNLVTPEILKPDVVGPGVDILAAWSEAVGPSGLDSDRRRSPYTIVSGTSMSCPHISGLAALIKAANPHWSPSAIKSALMTTAYTRDNTRSRLRDAARDKFSNPWAHGSGHVNPQKAISPGLVYDLSIKDYIAFLCSLDYTIHQIHAIVKHPNVTCSKKLSNPGQLNYPSFSVLFRKSRVVRYTRELTNVGSARSVYKVFVSAPRTVNVTVKPSKLVFKHVGHKLQYTVTFVSKKEVDQMGGRSSFGSISWNNAQHQVTSPVAFAWTDL